MSYTMKYEPIIEAILFAAGAPVSLTMLAQAIGQDTCTAKAIVSEMAYKYETEDRGLLIQEIDDGYQMCTNPNYFDYVQKIFRNIRKKTLTLPLMETLAIIAYKQPITKGRIEQIRGVNADHAVHKLMEYQLVVEKGRLEAPGKPILFGTSEEFLRYFGFQNLGQLPHLAENIDELKKEAEAEIDATISE